MPRHVFVVLAWRPGCRSALRHRPVALRPRLSPGLPLARGVLARSKHNCLNHAIDAGATHPLYSGCRLRRVGRTATAVGNFRGQLDIALGGGVAIGGLEARPLDKGTWPDLMQVAARHSGEGAAVAGGYDTAAWSRAVPRGRTGARCRGRYPTGTRPDRHVRAVRVSKSTAAPPPPLVVTTAVAARDGPPA